LFLILLLAGNLFSQTVPAEFDVEKILEICCNDLGFDILPDGRIIIINKFGKVKFYVNKKLRREFLNSTLPKNTFNKTESGLTGIALDPDYPVEPYLYLFYSHIDSTNRISRFTFKGDLTDVNSNNLLIEDELILLKIPFENDIHNGGTLRFGKDKTLYISYGDDHNRDIVQSLSNYNGKILRINRDGSVPIDNPKFPGRRNKTPETFAFGLRNPFRFSLNVDDELFIGDVGKSAKEELSISVGGENFGWPFYEGTKINDSTTVLIKPNPLFPIFEYNHTHPGNDAVIALLSYNRLSFGSFPEEFEDTYFYADFYKDWIRYLKFDGVNWKSNEFGTGFSFPVDAMLKQDGSIYILEYGVALSRIIYNNFTSIDENEIPEKFSLNQNYPNPFNPSTTITYELAERANINLEIYDIVGGHVYTLVNQYQQAGSYSIQWDGSNKFHQMVASGVYFYRIRVGSFTEIRKMVFIK